MIGRSIEALIFDEPHAPARVELVPFMLLKHGCRSRSHAGDPWIRVDRRRLSDSGSAANRYPLGMTTMPPSDTV